MTRCVLLKNNIVQNVIRVDADDLAIIAEDNPAGVNDVYDPVTGEFTKPPEPELVSEDPDVIKRPAVLSDLI